MSTGYGGISRETCTYRSNPFKVRVNGRAVGYFLTREDAVSAGKIAWAHYKKTGIILRIRAK